MYTPNSLYDTLENCLVTHYRKRLRYSIGKDEMVEPNKLKLFPSR